MAVCWVNSGVDSEVIGASLPGHVYRQPLNRSDRNELKIFDHKRLHCSLTRPPSCNDPLTWASYYVYRSRQLGRASNGQFGQIC